MSDELNVLAGAYALDALDEDERSLFEQHLTSCRDCADEVRGLQNTAAELTHTTALSPPAELRSDILAAIGRVRPSPPVTENVLAFRPRAATRWLWPAVAAACALIAVVAAGWGYQQRRSAARSSTQASGLYSVLTARDAASVSGPIGSTGQATMVFSKQQQQMVFLAKGIPALDKAKTYQLWTMTKDGAATSVGLFRPDSTGFVIVRSTGDLTDAAAIGVSIEPDGGSPKPTPTAIVTTMPLSR